MNDERTKAAATAASIEYLMQHRLRRTPERYAILDKVFSLSEHFLSTHFTVCSTPMATMSAVPRSTTPWKYLSMPDLSDVTTSAPLRHSTKSSRHNQPPPPRMHTVWQGQGGEGCRNRPSCCHQSATPRFIRPMPTCTSTEYAPDAHDDRGRQPKTKNKIRHQSYNIVKQ